MQSNSRNDLKLPFSDELEKFLGHIEHIEGKSRNTVNAYRRDLLDFMGFVADEFGIPEDSQPGVVSREDITHYLEVLGKGRREENKRGIIARKKVSARTQNRRLSALKSFFRYCCENGLSSADPTSDLKGAREDKKVPVVLTIEEVSNLIDSVSVEDLGGMRDRAIIECLYSTGLRVSELVSLDCGSIPSRGVSFKVIGKGEKERVVFLGDHAKNAVSSFIEQRRREGFETSPSSPLFINRKGGRLTSRSIQRMLNKRARDAGIHVKLTPHALRHSFATHLLLGGADLRVVQELLGHASLSTVQVYTHLTLGDLRERYLESHPLAEEE